MSVATSYKELQEQVEKIWSTTADHPMTFSLSNTVHTWIVGDRSNVQFLKRQIEQIDDVMVRLDRALQIAPDDKWLQILQCVMAYVRRDAAVSICTAEFERLERNSYEAHHQNELAREAATSGHNPLAPSSQWRDSRYSVQINNLYYDGRNDEIESDEARLKRELCKKYGLTIMDVMNSDIYNAGL